MNIVIIGAGPAGCYAGYLLARSGHQVEIYEEHPSIGQPIQCTGLLTADFDQFNLPKASFLVNTFSRVELHSPQQKTTLEVKEYLICRQKFDSFLASLARQAGAELFLNHSFRRKEGKSLVIKDKEKEQEKIIVPEIVIAADGPLSPTAKAYGLYHPQRENYYGIQAVVEGNFNPAAYRVFLGKDICPGFFAWMVPESSKKARVGLAGKGNSRTYFDQFLKRNNFHPQEIQAGVIPLHHPQQKLKKDNCYLLGDASGFVKATTLGGIVPSLSQAEILARCLQEGKDYEKEIRPLRRKMQQHRWLRKVLDKFSDPDWDRLLGLISQPKIQKILIKHNRDNPFPILIKSLLKEPRLLYFGRHLF